MLCIQNGYSPTLLYARQRVRGRHVERHDPAFGSTGLFSPGIYRLLLVEEGSCTVETSTGTHIVRSGGLVCLQSGSYRDLSMARESRAQMLAFLVMVGAELTRAGRAYHLQDEDHREPDGKDVWGCALPFMLCAELTAQLVQNIRHIAAIWWQDDWRYFTANNMLANLLLQLADYYRGQQPPSRPTSTGTGTAWLASVQQLIDEQLPMLRNTADLAAVFNRNPEALARTFKAHIGVSPARYLRQRRLERAADLVRRTRLPIRVIAEQLGYRHVAALDHAWKKRYEQPPLLCRQQWQR